jgi:hypothetical protein
MVMRIRNRLSRVATVFAVAAIGIISIVPIVNGTAAAARSSRLQGNGSVDEAWLAGANPGDRITLMQHNSAVSNVANPGTADSLGSLIIRNLTPGPGYRWVDNTTTQQTPTFSVLAPGVNPDTNSALYNGQPLHEGLNYITMRDGIQLAATVRYPYGGTCSAASPCPTVIEYSGYDTAGPTDPIPGIVAQALHTPCTNCGDPNLLPDTATAVGSVLARVSGFATVSLQMRGTGCSGGAFDLFGYPSDYDAYDAVEIVAHQSWVAHHKVGMVGISFSGLSEFPSAGTDPPGLAAIAPMSPTDDLFSTGYPGGIYNDDHLPHRRCPSCGLLRERSADPEVPDAHCQRRPAVDLLRDRRRAGIQRRNFVDLPGQPGAPQPVREPGQPGRAAIGGAGNGAGSPTIALRSAIHARVGEPRPGADLPFWRPAR